MSDGRSVPLPSAPLHPLLRRWLLRSSVGDSTQCARVLGTEPLSEVTLAPCDPHDPLQIINITPYTPSPSPSPTPIPGPEVSPPPAQELPSPPPSLQPSPAPSPSPSTGPVTLWGQFQMGIVAAPPTRPCSTDPGLLDPGLAADTLVWVTYPCISPSTVFDVYRAGEGEWQAAWPSLPSAPGAGGAWDLADG